MNQIIAIAQSDPFAFWTGAFSAAGIIILAMLVVMIIDAMLGGQKP